MLTHRFLFLLSTLVVISLGVLGQLHPGKHPGTQKEAIDTVMRLPEVRESNWYMQHHSRDMRKLFPLVYDDPTPEHPYWWIAVGEDNGICFVTHFGFYVYVKTGRILYMDPFADHAVDLRTWRQKRRRKQ